MVEKLIKIIIFLKQSFFVTGSNDGLVHGVYVQDCSPTDVPCTVTTETLSFYINFTTSKLPTVIIIKTNKNNILLRTMIITGKYVIVIFKIISSKGKYLSVINMNI